MNLAVKPWYKKKRYLIPLGIVALTVFGSMGDTSTSSAPVEQRAAPKIETTEPLETGKVSEPVVEQRPVLIPVQTKTEPQCNPNYSGCLKINAGDYDCAGGSGNGPNYTGKVQVLRYDEFDLDRDGDGWGCER